MTSKNSSLKRVGISLGIVIVVLGLIVLAIAYFGLGLFRSNPAQVVLAPMTQKLDSLGGKVICDDGTNGHSMLTSETAWYEVYYRVPDAASARKAFFAVAAASGYRLLPISGQSGEFGSDPKDGNGLTLDIYTDAKLRPTCYESNTGEGEVSISGTGAIYQIGFQ